MSLSDAVLEAIGLFEYFEQAVLLLVALVVEIVERATLIFDTQVRHRLSLDVGMREDVFEHHIIAEQSIDGICKEVRQPHKCPRTVVFQKLLYGVHVIVGRFTGFVERVVDDKAEIVVVGAFRGSPGRGNAHCRIRCGLCDWSRSTRWTRLCPSQ